MAMMTGVGGMPIILGNSWTPASLGATLKGWWDFSDASTLYTDAGTTLVSADGQAIYQANDKSGNNCHMVQATAGTRPAYKVNIQNGKSTGLFVAKSMVSAALPMNNQANMALVAVFQNIVKPGGTTRYFGNGSPPNANGYTIIQYSTTVWGVERGGQGYVQSSVAADTAWHTHVVRRDAVNWNYYLDGGSNIVTDVGTPITPLTGATLAGNNTYIAELLMLDTFPDTATLNQIGAYLYAKWNHAAWTDIT